MNNVLLAILDGSIIIPNMSYGWVVATQNGKILAWYAGLYNNKGNSFCTEGVGMLSATVFFALISEYTNNQLLTVTFISDNKELISRCDAHLQYKIHFPNKTIKSEYNSTEQIYCTALRYNLKASYHWVKGHQDNHTPTKELSIVA